MRLTNRVAQIITITSVFVIVNGFPQKPSSTDDSNININQKNQLLLRRIIEILSLGSAKTRQSESEEMHRQNKIIVDQEIDIYKRPKNRAKRYVCWHSCLGQWQQKNPRLKEMRRRISNINPGSGGSFKGEPEPDVTNNSQDIVTEDPLDPDITKTKDGDGENVITETQGSTDAEVTEASGAEAPETSDAEATPSDAEATAASDTEATEASDAEATETSDAEATEASDAEVTESADAEGEATEASDSETATEVPTDELVENPEDTEDGKEDKNEEKRHIGSNEEGFEDEYDEISAEGNGLDDDLPDDYVDQAAT